MMMENCEAILKLHLTRQSCNNITKQLSSLTVTKSTAWYTIQMFKKTKAVINHKNFDCSRSVRTKRLIESPREKISHKPKWSTGKLVADAEVGQESMKRVSRDYLKMTPYYLQNHYHEQDWMKTPLIFIPPSVSQSDRLTGHVDVKVLPWIKSRVWEDS